MNKVPGIKPEMLQRYLNARKAIAARSIRIINIAHLLNLLKHCDSDTVAVCPQVLASLADQIDSDICGIIESLDDFIYILDAEKAAEDS